MTAIGTRRMTLEEFAALPEGPPYYEFEDGELIPVSSPDAAHNELMALLYVALRQFVMANKLGKAVMEVDVFLPDGKSYIPDISFVGAARPSLFDPPDGKIHGSPDLVVELLSTNPARDRVRKFHIYHSNGVPWYWIVDPHDLTIEEYQATPEGYLRVSSVAAGMPFPPRLFPGFTVDLGALLGVAPDGEVASAEPEGEN